MGAFILKVDLKRNYVSETLADFIFEFFILIFSVWTVLAHAFMLAGFSFNTLIYFYSATVIPISFLYLRKKTFFRTSEAQEEYIVIAIIAALMLVGASLSLFSIRPDADDVNYLSRAVYYFENPGEPLDFEIHNHARASFDFRSPLLAFPVIELFWAYCGKIFNIHPLDVYHFAVPVLGGSLIPLVWYLLLSKFNDNQKAAVLGTAVIMAYLCMDGGTHRSFGNFSFVRIWQGKVMTLAIILPLLTSWSLDYFSRPGRRCFVKLLMLGVTAVGLAYTAFFIYPFLALLLGIAYVVACDKELSLLKIIPIYFVSLFYVFISALFVSMDAKQVGASEVLNEGWTVSLQGIMDFVFGGLFTFSSLMLYASVILGIILLKGFKRRFIAGWLILFALFFLNPLTNEFIAKNLTSLNAYWRVIYLLPFPLLPGLVVAAVFENRRMKAFFTILAAILVSAVLFNVIPNQVSVFGKVDFGLRHKIEQQTESDVREILAVAPDGPMLAPVRYSSIIPLFTSRLPQVAVRLFELELFASMHGKQAEAERRLQAVSFVTGENSSQNLKSFAEVTSGGINTVVFDINAAGVHEAAEILSINGFEPLLASKSFVLYSKIRLKNPENRN